MAELQPNDELLVNRNNVTYTEEQGTIMANLQGDDYLLINRADATYKITGQDFIDSVVDPLELTVVLDNTTPAPGDTINAIASPAGGKQPYTAITYQWKQRADDGQVTDIASATFSSLVITAEMAGFEIACEATVGDSLGSSVTTLSDYTDAVAYQEEVDTPELITPPDGAGLGAGISPESGVITDVTIEGANADMHGLRFDTARATYLKRTPSVAGNRKTWTWSGWVKRSSSARAILFGGGKTMTDTTHGSIEFEGDGSLRVNGWFQSWAISNERFTDYSVWVHLVVSFDSTQLTAGNQVKMYANGQQLTKATENALTQNEDYGINQAELHTIGAISIDENPKSDIYLSDVYFVDGQALEPEVFGKSFEGRWGPLDSSDVKTNIAGGVKSPSDSCPNYDQKWSDSLTTSGIWYSGRGPEMAFNGVVERANGAATGDGQVLTFDPKITIPENSVIEVDCGTSSADWNITVDGVPGQIIPEGMGFTSITYNNGTTFPKLEIKSTDPVPSADLIAIRLNGRLLIDGPADNSQVWSSEYLKVCNRTDGTVVNASVKDPANGFDGTNSTTAGTFDKASQGLRFDIPSGFDSTDSIKSLQPCVSFGHDLV